MSMTASAIWKGIIQFGMVSVPVKFFSAVEDRKVHFRMLHRTDHAPVKQKMVNPRTGKPVPYEEIRRGYMDKGEIVLLEDQELQSIEPEPSREIEITRFVDPAVIKHQWYDRPYYLGPDGNSETYFALAKALERSDLEGFARWTMRKKAYIGALRVEAGRLIMITLRYAREVIDASELPRPKTRSLEQQEIRMAEQLVQALEGDFDPAAFKDEYRNRVMELIETKARGGKLELLKPKKRKAEVVSLTDMLRRSVRKIREERKVA
jgi:DNA end-binding protein Ku